MEDGATLRLLVQHAVDTLGLDLRETDYARESRPGEFVHLATKDPLQPPNVIRLLLRDQDEVRRIISALHGQSILVGRDRVGIQVHNDYVAMQGLPGDCRRGRA